MTDKEIIIDGVDVSKCDRLIVNQLYGYVCNCEEDTHIISSCKNRHNCYYKQLARKTQECEELHTELKFKVEYIQKQREVIKDLEKKLKISIQALEELEMTEKQEIIINGQGCRYKTWDKDCALSGDNHGDNMQPCKFIDEKNCCYKQLKAKKQECERLRKFQMIVIGWRKPLNIIGMVLRKYLISLVR